MLIPLAPTFSLYPNCGYSTPFGPEKLEDLSAPPYLSKKMFFETGEFSPLTLKEIKP